MTFLSYRAGSRTDWGKTEGDGLTIEQINCGAILRIADAIEKMAANHIALIEDRDRQKRWREDAEASLRTARRSNRALRGVINRMKRKGRKP